MRHTALLLLVLAAAACRGGPSGSPPVPPVPGQSAGEEVRRELPVCPAGLSEDPSPALDDTVVLRIPVGADVGGLSAPVVDERPDECESHVAYGRVLELEADPARAPSSYFGEMKAIVEAAGFDTVAQHQARLDTSLVFTVEVTLQGSQGEDLIGLVSVRVGQGRAVGLAYVLDASASSDELGVLAASADSLLVLPPG